MRRNRRTVSRVTVAAVASDANVLVLGPIPAPGSQEGRLVGATLRCIARWGVGKTTLDDVARQAGCSRATVYRVFPGGKEGLVEALVRVELARFFTGMAARLDRVADHGLEAGLVAGMADAGRRLPAHDALQYLLAHEPEGISPR